MPLREILTAVKTTLFNALTGSNQFVGNWPGVTVEKKEGKLKKARRHNSNRLARYIFTVSLHLGRSRRKKLSYR
ncbi:MAG: FeoB small GTPase domain-containing protein [Acutalibacteraceae bacterium]